MKEIPPAIRIWGMPIVLGILSTTGLLAALFSDGIGDVISWITLGIPLVVIARYLRL